MRKCGLQIRKLNYAGLQIRRDKGEQGLTSTSRYRQVFSSRRDETADDLDEIFTVTLFFVFPDTADFAESLNSGRLGRSKQMEDLIGKNNVGRDGLLVGKLLAEGTQSFE